MQGENFVDYYIPEVKIKISYPETWKIDEVGLPKADDTVLLAIMFKKLEGSRPSVTILVNQIPPSAVNVPPDGRSYLESNIADLKNKYDDFVLVESGQSTLGGNTAHQSSYIQGGAKISTIATIKENKIFNVIYRSNPTEFSQYLPIAERMRNSFQFLS